MSKKVEDKKYELEKLKKYIDKYGIPKQKDFNNGILKSITYYTYNFGSLKKVYELIGVVNERAEKHTISPEKALEELKEYVEKNGVPSFKEIEKNHKKMGLRSASYYIKYFGNWGKTLEKIGYKNLFQISELNNFTNEELIENLKKWDIDYIYKNIGFLRRRFKKNTYSILKLVGREKETKIKFLSKQDYIDIMKNINYPITLDEFKNNYASVSTNFKKYFGTWNNFLKECGFDTNLEVEIINKSDDEIVQEYKDISIAKGYTNGIPSIHIKKELGYSKGFISYRFGSISKLKELAGFNSKRAKPSFWSKDKILKILSSKERMTTEEIRNCKELPAPSTLFRIFQTTSINKIYQEVEEYNKIKFNVEIKKDSFIKK